MTDNDMVRLCGIDYDIGPFDEDDSFERTVLYLRRKLIQTGWECHCRIMDLPTTHCVLISKQKPTNCIASISTTMQCCWMPYYKTITIGD